MRRPGLYSALLALAVAACGGNGGSIAGPPAATGADTLTFPDPTGSANPGRVHFELVRSAASNVPATADSALVRVYNNSSGFEHFYAAKIPVAGRPTIIDAWVPSDTGYVVNVIAFHGSNILDAAGTTLDDTTITVLPAGGPTYTGTPVTVPMVPAPFAVSFSLNDGDHVTAGEHIGFWATAGGPPDIWTRAESSWGCMLAPYGMCSTPGYLALVPNTPGPWKLEISYFADWGDRSFSLVATPITIIIDQGSGDIIVTFDKHH